MPSNLANLLTFGRIAAIPFVVALTLGGLATGAAALFVAVALTDALDGWVARTWNQTSDIGRMMDPIADKLLVGATLLMLAAQGALGSWGLMPALVIMLREILVSGLREFLAGRDLSLPVSRLAKVKTGVQMAALAGLLAGGGVGRIAAVLLWIAAGLTVVTGWSYLATALREAGPGERPA